MPRPAFFPLLLLLCCVTLPLCAQRTEGQASYYADRFHARPTSTGEKYDKELLTAASKEYPYNSVLEVTNVVNGKQVRVRVNDCGPHHPDRIIDLSKAAARKIGLLRSGTAQVRLRLVSRGQDGPTCERSAWAAAEKVRRENESAGEETTTVVAVTQPSTPKGPTAPTTPAVDKRKRRPAAPPRNREFADDEMLFGVQVGAFGKEANANRLVERLTELGFTDVWSVKMGRVYRVYTGKYYFQDEAEALKLQVREAGFRDASVRRVQ